MNGTFMNLKDLMKFKNKLYVHTCCRDDTWILEPKSYRDFFYFITISYLNPQDGK